MSDMNDALATLRQEEGTRQRIQDQIARIFAPEDDALRNALVSAKQAGLPEIQISPIQGKFLQLMAAACNARKILEIGALGGYSGIWLARALPAGGRLITLEINPTHAEVVRNSFARAGLSDRTEVRVGKALDLLPQLESEAPFDLVFIDADKQPYPQYLEWALRLIRPGSIIVADNCIRGGRGFGDPMDEGSVGVFEYNQRIASDPRLVSLDLAMDDNFTDGFAISVVKG
ncbi:MAG TPA: O-methyltransferase [Ktedonobacteraceae bacterium]|jgi:caffeoyl-CoA O-methyltransferase|nr:O-methyltransferase [Ktedonobacteraceae bacterium]